MGYVSQSVYDYVEEYVERNSKPTPEIDVEYLKKDFLSWRI